MSVCPAQATAGDEPLLRTWAWNSSGRVVNGTGRLVAFHSTTIRSRASGSSTSIRPIGRSKSATIASMARVTRRSTPRIADSSKRSGRYTRRSRMSSPGITTRHMG